MIYNNFIKEVYDLYKRNDLTLKNNSINAIGYKDLWLYLNNQNNLKKTKISIIQKTYNLANQQLLWLRKWHNIFYFNSYKKKSYIKIYKLINKYLFTNEVI